MRRYLRNYSHSPRARHQHSRNITGRLETDLNREDSADERLEHRTDQTGGDERSRGGSEKDEEKIVCRVCIVVERRSGELDDSHRVLVTCCPVFSVST